MLSLWSKLKICLKKKFWPWAYLPPYVSSLGIWWLSYLLSLTVPGFELDFIITEIYFKLPICSNKWCVPAESSIVIDQKMLWKAALDVMRGITAPKAFVKSAPNLKFITFNFYWGLAQLTVDPCCSCCSSPTSLLLQARNATKALITSDRSCFADLFAWFL